MRKSLLAPPAHLTLRAHLPAPARVELVHLPASGRAVRTLLWLGLCWGSIPFLLWIPPHYPWIAAAFAGGAYLAHRTWTGRYTIRSFAGICPRCASPLSIGAERTVDLPHTLTCFSCHFEPRLEVTFARTSEDEDAIPAHQSSECVGEWRIRWLADEAFLFCDTCHAGGPATPAARKSAEAENQLGEVLERLTDEGTPLI